MSKHPKLVSVEVRKGNIQKAITRMETNKNSIKKNKVAFNANKTAN